MEIVEPTRKELGNYPFIQFSVFGITDKLKFQYLFKFQGSKANALLTIVGEDFRFYARVFFYGCASALRREEKNVFIIE
jgi:hypothetical protein